MLWRNAIRASSIMLAFAISVAGAQRAQAQAAAKAAPPDKLSLEEALALARQQSPDFLKYRNDVVNADWGVREAYGQLLPTASVGTALQYQAAGTPQFGIFSSQDIGISSTPAYYTSQWNLNFGYSVSGARLFAPQLQRANRRFAAARFDAQGLQLDEDVTRQYLKVLQAQDAVTVAKEQLANASENLRLAEARVKVGTAIPLEAKQAQVDRGRAEVALLRAQNQVGAEKATLSQRIGIELPASVQLTSSFEVFTPRWTEAELLARALNHQAIRASVANEEAAAAGVRAARTQYLPSLDFAVGFSGYAREAGNAQSVLKSAQSGAQGRIDSCQLLNDISAGLKSPLPNTPADCSVFALTPDQERAVLDNNNVFPFRYTKQPWYAQVRISLPIFGGLTRERQLESAKVAAENARLQTRLLTLTMRTALSTAYATLVTAQKAYEIELANREAAAEQLALEQERYRVGASSFVQLQAAQTRKAEADKSYVDAVYAFHDALAVLENGVGEKLSNPKDR